MMSLCIDPFVNSQLLQNRKKLSQTIFKKRNVLKLLVYSRGAVLHPNTLVPEKDY